ncbi:competence protein ComK [Niallia sp. 03133]|uniref:competence protein ComK n=1 Tax=Niallia sp. 03133 TaxID=3458060 RepID=UPI004043B057
MTTILSDYDINEKTMALLPAFHHEYDTIVLEVNQILFVKQTALKLIEKAAIKGGADYRGRRTYVIYLLGEKNKIPIPINETKQIYAFPTKSPSHINCSWIFFHHVECIQKPNHSTPKEFRSIVVFKNGQELPIKESPYTLDKQMYRTWKCIKDLGGDDPSISIS